MKFLDADAVHDLLDYPSLVDGLAAEHRQPMDAMDRLHLQQPDASGGDTHFLLLPAWQRGRACGVKLVTVFPENLDAGELPSIQGVYVLFDGTDGAPLAVIDGTALTLRKTAADSALGARLLARDDAERMLMVGAGALAPHLVRAHVAIRPSLRRVAVWNRTAARAAAVAADLSLCGVTVDATEDIEAAARGADLICCATASTAPLIRGAWLKPGAHLDLIGSFTPEMRECDDEAMARGRVHVDSRDFTVGTCGDLMAPMASGALTEADIRGDLFQLCQGTVPGRTGADEVTVFKNGGGGHLDLMTAIVLLQRADVAPAG